MTQRPRRLRLRSSRRVSSELSFGPERPTVDNRWDEKAGLPRDALSSQVIDTLEAREDRGDRR
jgi:hypothetical protein